MMSARYKCSRIQYGKGTLKTKVLNKMLSLTWKMSLIMAFLSTNLVVANTKEEQLKYTLHEFKDHTGKVQVSLSNAGEGTFSGPLISHSGTCGVQQITVDGNATFFEDVIVPTGEARARSVIVYHQLMARETSTVDFYGKVTFGGVAPAAVALPQKPKQHQHQHQHQQYHHHHHHQQYHHHYHPHHHHHHHNNWEHQQQHRQKQTPDVHFINGWKSSGNVQVEGSVDTTSAKVTESVVVGTYLKAGNKVEAPELIATDLIQGKTIQVLEALEVKGITTMHQSLLAKSDIGTSKNLQVNGTAKIHSLVSLKKAVFEEDIDIKGSATVVKLLKSQGECIVEGGMYVGGEAKFRETVLVNDLQASTNMSVGENLSVKGNVWMEKDAQVHGNFESGVSVEAPTVKARAMMLTPMLNVSSQIDSRFIQTSNLHVFYDTQVGGNVHVSKNTLVAGNLTVGQFITTNSVDIKHSMNASSANITGHLIASSLNVSSISVFSQLEVVGPQSKALQSINGFESSNGGIEVASNIVSHGMLVAELGVSTSNLTAHGTVTFKGNDTFIERLQVQEVIVDGGKTNTSGIWLKHGANMTVDAPGFLHSRGGIIIDNGTMSEFRGDAIVSGRFEFAETLKVTGTVNSASLFTSRIYTEDLSARGFVSASAIVSTGDVDVSKNVNVRASVVAEERVEAADIVSRKSITAPSATLDRISAAAMTTQKLMISTELLVQDVNVMQLIEKELRLLKERIDALEHQLSSYIEL